MAGDRYVILGLAPPRARWFEAVAQWTTSAALAGEFVKCLSGEEVRMRLASGRLHSALIVDTSSPSLDRDLIELAESSGVPVIVVVDSRSSALSISEIGASAQLAQGFSREDLVEVLAAHCRMVGRGDSLPAAITDGPESPWRAQLITVCGPGGTGASTLAIALAQGFSADPRLARRVVLADLARRGDQAMLHDAMDLGPGIQELVDAHRIRRPDPEEVRRMTFDAPRRGYRLLLGLRQAEGWAALRPRSVDAAVEGLRRAFQLVVADVTGDVEGEAQGGSVEVEERNHLARCAVLHSGVVVAVGAPGMKGVHSLAVLIRSLVVVGVPENRIVAVVNRSPRNPRARADCARALAAILSGSGVELAMAGPVAVPERKLEEHLRDGTALPAAVVDPLTRAVRAFADRLADDAPPAAAPVRVQPGSLGSWMG